MMNNATTINVSYAKIPSFLIAKYGNIQWHGPIISEGGIEKFGKEFWEGFVENSELGYVSAETII